MSRTNLEEPPLSSSDEIQRPVEIEDSKVHEKRNHFKKKMVVIILLLLSAMFIPHSASHDQGTPPSHPFNSIIVHDENPFVQYAYAAEEANGMVCVTTKCSKELSKCLTDATCAKGLGCFIACSSNDKVEGSDSREGSCQVRCMDLFQNTALDDFTDCTLRRHRCYKALKADERYPSLPINLSDPRLLVETEGIKEELTKLLRGKWYVSAGLNEAFDTFDCQVHEFYEPNSIIDEEDSETRSPIAQALFSYRIKQNGGFFTKHGEKQLSLVDEHCDGDGGGENGAKETIYDGLQSQIKGDKKWGVDVFHQTSATWPEKNRKHHRRRQQEGKKGKQLQLTLLPKKMDYKDNWNILAYNPDQNHGYIVLAYRGTNSAWDGYGGVNVYTRQPMDITSSSSQYIQKEGIHRGLEKIGLTIEDLIPVDNTCK